MNQEKIMDILNRFSKEIDEAFVGKTPKMTGGMDRIYDCDIYIFRHPGMGNSKQLVSGNPVSIYAATASYLETLLRKEIFEEEELYKMVEMAIKGSKGLSEDE